MTLAWDERSKHHAELVAGLQRCACQGCSACAELDLDGNPLLLPHAIPVPCPTALGLCIYCFRADHPKGDRRAPGGLQPIRPPRAPDPCPTPEPEGELC